MELDENLAAVHAYLCADGYVIKNPLTQKQKYYVLGFRNTNIILLRDFQEKFFQYFNIKPHLVPGQRCRIGSRTIYEALTSEFGSFYSREWKIPFLDKSLLRIWLRAYFDCEGWVALKSHKNRMVGAECVNFAGLKQVQEALNVLGIISKIKKKSKRNIFGLYIFGKENISTFKKEIGFLHPDKKEKLEKALEDYLVYEWNFPSDKEDLALFIERLMKKKACIKRSTRIVQVFSNREMNLLALQKYLKEIFKIESLIRKSINGIGTIYYQLSINKKSEINKLISHNLLSEEKIRLWNQLKK